MRATYQTKHSWGYKGATHRYTIHHRGMPNSWASFQLARKYKTAVVNRFFGYTQRFVLPGIEVMETGFGWHRVYLADDESNPDMIIALFRMINNVIFKMQPAYGPQLKRRYALTVDKRGRTMHTVEEAKPAAVGADKLHMLVTKINSKYGHAHA